ncbi:MAG: DNA modification methylase [Phycisphaeraceae bacterium]|nr:DNA modification methylase [Phycisphaeraceae bacterium]
MKLLRLSINRINPAPYNPRKALAPGDPEFEKLRRSISEFGLVEPLIWNKRTGNLVGGHQRFAVLMAEGAKTVEVSVVDLPLEKEKALNLALNKIQGEWDQDKLAALLDELTKESSLDLDLTGFAQVEADAIIAEFLDRQSFNGNDSDFKVDAELERIRKVGKTVTKPGDLIVLGNDPRLQHVLLCGDCTKPADVQRLMGDDRAILFATDPPYLVDYDGTNHPGKKRAPAKKNKDWSGSYGLTWDDAKANADLYQRFIATAVEHAIATNAAWYCWHASRRQAMLEAEWKAAGAFVHQQIIWAKNRPILTRSHYGWQHEPCFYGWLEGKRPPRNKDAPNASSVWQIDTIARGEDRPDHPTPKPLEVFEIPMLQHTRAGEICYEPFAGSGTQIIAAQKLKRRCRAIEISPVYCDLIVRRFIAFAGRAAVAPEIARKYAIPQSVAEGSHPRGREKPSTVREAGSHQSDKKSPSDRSSGKEAA